MAMSQNDEPNVRSWPISAYPLLALIDQLAFKRSPLG
jgi:hypothetical protein